MKRDCPDALNTSGTTLSTSDGEQSPRKRRRHVSKKEAKPSSEPIITTYCRLCSSSLVGKNKVMISPCFHDFCFACLVTWDKTRRRDGQVATGCPFCISMSSATTTLPLTVPVSSLSNTTTSSSLYKRAERSYYECPREYCKKIVNNMARHMAVDHPTARCDACLEIIDTSRLAHHIDLECREQWVQCVNRPFGCAQTVKRHAAKMTDEEAYTDHRCIAVIPCILCTPMHYVGQGRDGWMYHNQMHSTALHIKQQPAPITTEMNHDAVLSCYDDYY